jgi:hypothetical protein
MSAAATAAGYLYASGRLRGRAQREQEGEKHEAQPEDKPARPRAERPRIEKPIRVAALPAPEDARPRKTPTIQYRTRRWKPEQNGE